MQTSERYVRIAEAEGKDVPAAIQSAGGLAVPKALEFKPSAFRYFKAEYALSDRDVIIHFYVSDPVRAQWDTTQIERWWLRDFAATLSTVAQDYFQATVPRIVAKYTPEAASWWFKAQGYDYLLDLEAFLRAFYERLDETLHSALVP
jgi:hypothetical protein